MPTRRDLALWLGAGALGWACPCAAAARVSYAPLFLIARSKNRNVVHYSARLQDGQLHPESPVEAHWQMLAEDGRREELSWAERKLAYGFSVSELAPESCRLQLVAFKNRSLSVERQAQSFRAVVSIAGKRAVLERIFVQTHEGGILPSVEYLELFGTALSGGAVNERLTAR